MNPAEMILSLCLWICVTYIWWAVKLEVGGRVVKQSYHWWWS